MSPNSKADFKVVDGPVRVDGVVFRLIQFAMGTPVPDNPKGAR